MDAKREVGQDEGDGGFLRRISEGPSFLVVPCATSPLSQTETRNQTEKPNARRRSLATCLASGRGELTRTGGHCGGWRDAMRCDAAGTRPESGVSRTRLLPRALELLYTTKQHEKECAQPAGDACGGRGLLLASVAYTSTSHSNLDDKRRLINPPRCPVVWVVRCWSVEAVGRSNPEGNPIKVVSARKWGALNVEMHGGDTC